MVGHGGISASSYLANPTSPIPSHCASVVATSTLRFNITQTQPFSLHVFNDRHTNQENCQIPIDACLYSFIEGKPIALTVASHHTINRAAFVCLSVCSLSPPRSFDRSSPNLVGVCRWTSELPLRGSFSKRSTARRVNGSLSLATILYMCQPHSTQLQKATLLLLHLIRLKGTFCCIDGWWVYVGGSRNCLLDG